MFRNITSFQIPASTLELRTAGAWENLLMKAPLSDTMPALSTRIEGAVPLTESGVYAVESEGQILFKWGMLEKKIPAAAVKRAAAAKAKAFEAEKGFKPGRKLMREIKESVTVDLLPNAVPLYRELRVWIDLKNDRLHVEASSNNTATTVVAWLRDLLGSLEATPTIEHPSALSSGLTGWLMQTPNGIEFDGDCTLVGPDKQKISFKSCDNTADRSRIFECVQAGYVVEKLRANVGGASVTIDKSGQLAAVKYPTTDETEAAEAGDEIEALQANLLLGAATVRQIEKVLPIPPA